MKKTIPILFILLSLSLLAMNVWSIRRMLPVGQDDTLFSALAHTFIHTGRFEQPMIRTIPLLGGEERVYGRLFLAGLIATGYLIGPSILSDRIWSFFMMLLALALVGYLARRSIGRYWRLFVVVLCMAEPMFFLFSHTPRPEMTMCVLFLLGTVAGLRALEKDSAAWFFLAGLLGSLAIDVHLNGVILAPSIGLSLIAMKSRTAIQWKRLLWFAAGAAAGVLWYAGWHILPDPRLYFGQLEYYSLKEGFSSHDFHSVLLKTMQEYKRYRIWFWGSGIQRIRLLEAVLIVVGLICSVRSRKLCTRYLGLITICLIVIQTFAVSRKVEYYLMPLYPLFVLHAAVALRAIYVSGRAMLMRRHPGGAFVRAAALSGLIAFAGFYTLQDVAKIHRFMNGDYERYAAEITSVVPPGIVVAGSPSLWYALGERNDLVAHLSIIWAIRYGHRCSGSVAGISEIVEREKIQAIVVEPFFRELISTPGEIENSMRTFLQSNCRLVKSFRSTGYKGIGECSEGDVTQIFTVLNPSPGSQ